MSRTRNTTMIRFAATAAAVALSVGLAGAGVAAAATPPAVPQPTPPAATGPSKAAMDQHMAQMIAGLPAAQRADAQRMHDQMRPAMEHMMTTPGAMMGKGSIDMGSMMGG